MRGSIAAPGPCSPHRRINWWSVSVGRQRGGRTHVGACRRGRHESTPTGWIGFTTVTPQGSPSPVYGLKGNMKLSRGRCQPQLPSIVPGLHVAPTYAAQHIQYCGRIDGLDPPHSLAHLPTRVSSSSSDSWLDCCRRPLTAIMLGPTAIEAVPYDDPYADAQGRDVGGRSPSAGGAPLPASANVTWMQQPETVSIRHGRHVVRAAATKPEAVAYAMCQLFAGALDRVSSGRCI